MYTHNASVHVMYFRIYMLDFKQLVKRATKFAEIFAKIFCDLLALYWIISNA